MTRFNARTRDDSQLLRLGFVLLVAVVLSVPAFDAAAGSAAARDGDSQKRLEEVRRQIDEVRTQLKDARDTQSRLREQLRVTEVEIGKLSRSLRELEQASQAKSTKLRDLRVNRDEARAALEQHREALRQQMIAGYAMGHQGHLKIILSQEDPSTLGRMLTYYDYFNRARAERISEVNAGLQEIEILERDISREAEALEALHAEQSLKLASLEESRGSRGQILAKIDSEIQTREQRLEALLQDEGALSELVERLRRTQEAMPPDTEPFPALKGKLPMPVQGKVVARFGAHRRAEGGGVPWRGVMIEAEEGQEVQAIYGGRVVFADWMRGFGLLIIVDHGNGYMSLYGHNQSLYRQVGDWVGMGDLIATVGSSGGRETPGLYFEIRHDGVPDNPMAWCRADSR